ncbi:DUF1799 domain-containing protein [Pigmentiphaga litoralis]|uniref:DUF1799 domain-containing protein n=1 Tax=Pigmentiphaga litoralis TaxID=516702 RepID=UPI001677BD45|nr:DUF1799 domain-containing protein [Pigmentiphaga litoralis]
MPGDWEDEPVEVWPDNQAAFDLFCRLSTQWRAGASGFYGLDYGVMFQMMARMRLTDPERDALEGDVRVMEAEALDVMNSQRENLHE